MNIPSGLTTLEETCGKNTGVMQPGAKWCYCKHKRVACMVSQAMIQYNAPVRNCPTKDNGYISIDLYFTFKLPRSEQQVRSFVYKLGAARFDELIEAEIEEGVRSFINGIWLSQVFDLKEEMTKKFKDELNSKFSDYGIVFESCVVNKVHVNETMTKSLQEKAKIKYDLKSHLKEFDNQKLTANNQENQKLTELRKDNERKLQELSAKSERS